MKKIILICLLFTSLFLNAQIENVRLGLNFEPFSPSWMSSNTSKVSLENINVSTNVGAKFEFHFSQYLAIASGIGMQFNQGGVLRYAEGGDVWVDAELDDPSLHNLPADALLKYKIRYFELPLALKMRTNEFGKYRIFFEVPRLTFGATTKARGDVVAQGLNYEKQNIYKSMSWLNISYGIMAGTEYSLSEDISLLAGIHYKQGIFDVTEDKVEDSKITTGTLGIIVGILF